MDHQIVCELVAVVGPTASGKTALSIELARRLDGEIVSADSMAVYRYMDVGTAKPDAAERRAAVFHMIDVAEPGEPYNAGIYERQAEKAIASVISRGRLPILCGGSGLYIQSVLYGLGPSVPGCDPAVRSLIDRVCRRKGLGFLRDFLKKTDPAVCRACDLENPRRVRRLLEIYKQTGIPPSEIFKDGARARYEAAVFGLEMSRETLHKRINERVDRMLECGLENEVRLMLSKSPATSLQAIGYKEMAEYIRGECSLSEAAEKIKAATRQLAKRQICWFKRDKSIIWINMDELSLQDAANLVVRRIKQ
ncbi:MAG: tRNA (adenosine(37)-N6)-dimethylallyltransferase MiaA [Abditibacteriota bacterium]|nr:tRNA (adenosine(37)-N6)-dimethylallyltransferase MiaA [Abditibacteriota bacterium]